MNTFTDGDIEYFFERRRYGGGPSIRFFTWLNYRFQGETQWRSYGDPWPKVRLKQQEIADALADIRSKRARS